MRHIFVILGLLLLVAVAFGVTLFVEEPPLSHGGPHPKIDGMKVGGDGAARMEGIGAAAFILQAGTLVLCAAMMTLGVARRRRTRGFWIGIGGITLAALLVWWRLFDSYVGFLVTGETRTILGFPEPSAWLVYGVWGTAALYSVLYVVGFRRFIYTEEDERAFNDLVREIRKEREGA